MLGSHDSRAFDSHLATMKEIVSQLKYMPLIEKRLHQYYSFKQNPLVPKPVILHLMETLRSDLVSSGHVLGGTDERVELNHVAELSQAVLRSSSTEVVITPSTEVDGFFAMFCGSNLRVETIGLCYTMAARASLFWASHDDDKDDIFVQDMIWYSKLSLELSRELSPQSTDFIIWLANENCQLRSFLEGDASESFPANLFDSGMLIVFRPQCVAISG